MPPEAQSWLIYQPLLVGLGAVIVATLGNTLLEWFRQHLTNKTAADTLRRALAEELRIYKQAAETNSLRASNPSEGGSFLIPIAEEYPIYDANISHLGRLTPREVSAVVYAYALLRAQKENLCVIGTFHRMEGMVLHAVVDAKWSDVLAENTQQLGMAVTEAIDSLEARGKRRALDRLPGEGSEVAPTGLR